ncbi:MAG TPA: ATP-binding protein [Nitrospirota bacterium]
MKSIRVLVVDDDMALAKLTAKTLSREASDFSVDIAGGGQECLEHLSENRVDCILSDYQMPRMNGMELLKRLKAKGDDTPFIFVTGQGNEEVAREAFKEGAYDYFTKDAEFAHFTRIINSIEQAVRQAQANRERETAVEFVRIVNENEGIGDLIKATTAFFQKQSGCSAVGIRLKDGEDYCSTGGELCDGEEYESLALLPLRFGKDRLGLLQLNDRRKGMFSPEVIRLWERLADKLAVAVAKCLAEDELRKSEYRYRLLFENMPDGFAYCKMLSDDNGNPVDFVYLAVNSAFGRLTGLDNVVGKKATEAITGIKESHPELLEAYGRVALTGLPEKFEIEFNPLGIWLRVSVYSAENGYFTAIFDNITERRRMENELRESQAKFRWLYESNLLGVAFWNIEGCFIEANSAFYELIGFEPEDARADKWQGITPPEWLQRDNEAFEEIRQNGFCKPYEKEYIRRDGRRVPALITGGMLAGSDHDGIAFIIDISERKELERQKEEFMAMMTHDLKSPIATILGYCDLIVRTLDKKDMDLVDGIQAGAAKLKELIDNFLTLTKLEAGKVMLNPEPTDISVLLEKAGKEFSIVAARKGIFFQMEVSSVPRIPLDWKYMERAISNLVQNAINYTDAGGRVLIKAESGQGPYISISVKDDGAGIPQDDLDKIFQKYYRSPKTSGIKGTGLGLAIVKLVVDAHNGRVEVRSEAGKGSEFTIFLPLK